MQDGPDWKERAETLQVLDDLFASSLLDKHEVIIAVQKLELLVVSIIRIFIMTAIINFIRVLIDILNSPVSFGNCQMFDLLS